MVDTLVLVKPHGILLCFVGISMQNGWKRLIIKMVGEDDV